MSENLFLGFSITFFAVLIGLAVRSVMKKK